MKSMMKNQTPDQNFTSNHQNHQKHNSHISMSDTESQASQLDSFHSPLRSPEPHHPPKSPSKAIVTVDKYFSPNLNFPATPQPPAPADTASERRSPVVYFSRAIREDSATGVVKQMGPARADVEGGDGGGERRRSRTAGFGRPEREIMLNRAGLGFRICEVIFCLISFSVMAADKTQGWTGDSFDRYKEYRFCVAVNVIGFVYSGFQAFDLAYSLATQKHFLSSHARYYFDFLADQILAYLLMSASSSAATRVDDWASNWGKDAFTEMASASIALSFLAFLAFAFSSLISGYILCNRSSS